MHNFVHIQFQVTDLDEATKFYSNVFEWKISKSPAMENYAFYEIDEEGEQVGGGFFVNGGKPSTGTCVLYINANDIPSKLKLIEEYGGKILMEKTPLPGGHGFVARFEDPFGNALGLWSEE
ncbi:MAG: VOC family protein [Candidatus Hodarchaeota archaeon]